ncbi:hypothetical protein FF1_046696 [Malus domestica]
MFENSWPTVPSPPQKLRPVRGIDARSPMDSERKPEDVGPTKVGSGDEVDDESSSSSDDERAPKKNNIVNTAAILPGLTHLPRRLPSLHYGYLTVRQIRIEGKNQNYSLKCGNEDSRGALVVLEGLDRCGKTTQSARLVTNLERLGYSAELWRFPDRNA